MHRLFVIYTAVLVVAFVLVAAVAGRWAAASDRIEVTLDPAVAAGPVSGRLIVFMVDSSNRRLSRRAPARGPFWEPPQPIFSVAVTDWAPGTTRVIDGAARAFPRGLDHLSGTWRVQAVLDQDDTERSALEGPGNALSPVATLTLEPGRADRLDLVLSTPISGPPAPVAYPRVDYVRVPSPRLSAFYGRDVHHHAAVVRPPAYDDRGNRRFAAVYLIPGYGGRVEVAPMYAQMLDQARDLAPEAVYVVLDPESPLGHHGFCDSPNHGPRGTAFVEELIPWLEANYALDPRPAARLLTGHSSGGWSSLWLQLNWPEVFGGCWSSAPDPVDFTAFQNTDIYRDRSLYEDETGQETPSYRVFETAETMVTRMTVREEGRMEWAMSPDGRSGQQWDGWEAMFSPRDPATGLPRPLFDGWTGVIDRAVAEHWRAYDLTRLLMSDWERLGPVLMERVRLSCGDLDSFFLNRAVARLKVAAEARAEAGAGWSGPGYIQLLEGKNHSTVIPAIQQDQNREMRAHLIEHGLMTGQAAPDPLPKFGDPPPDVR